MSGPGVLVVAGEASGDRAAALVVRALAAEGVRAWGAGGPACRAAGMEVVADTAILGAMGIGDVAARLPAIASAVARIWARVRRDPPRAAILADFAELNARLGRVLRARGVRVLRLSAPQVWAWRPGRLASLRGAFDRLAVLLPFEEALWRGAGHDARYVGHPVMEAPATPRGEARDRLGIPGDGPAVAVLPGSRAGEVRRLAGPLCEAAAALAAEGAAARLILSPGLDARGRAAVLEHARRARVEVVEGDRAHGAAPLLGAFDAALCASGTATLEAAIAGAAPVVVYRLDAIAYAVARRLVRTPHVALPNVLLGRRAYPEILQGDVTPGRIAEEARALLARPGEARALAAEIRAALAPPSARPFGVRVADLVLPWLAR
jgi:lipid-A-disaccharide synthase